MEKIKNYIKGWGKAIGFVIIVILISPAALYAALIGKANEWIKLRNPGKN